MSLSVSKYKLAELSAAAGLAYGKPHSALLPISSPLNEVYLISAPIPITAGYVYQWHDYSKIDRLIYGPTFSLPESNAKSPFPSPLPPKIVALRLVKRLESNKGCYFRNFTVQIENYIRKWCCGKHGQDKKKISFTMVFTICVIVLKLISLWPELGLSGTVVWNCLDKTTRHMYEV